MPAPYYYYTYPFGQNADDLTAIPTTAAVDGSVSYYAGWTDPYEYNLLTNPAALPIPRGQMNQLFFDITNNLQEYQQYGSPQWVTGNTVAYPIYARVYYSGVVYENQVAANTVTPGADSSWLAISGASDSIRSGMIVDYAGPIAPSGYLACNGSSVSRSTYPLLLAALTQVQTTTTTISATVTGLTNATTTMYPGMAIESANFSPGTTILSITNATTVVMSTTATAASSTAITFFNWGNGNGSTTFNVPNLNGAVTAGEGGTLVGNPSAQVDVAGQTTGSTTRTLSTANVPAHTHVFTENNTPLVYNGGDVYGLVGGGSGVGVAFTVSSFGTTSTGSQPFTTNVTGTTDNGSGSGSAFGIVQPTAIVIKIIKT